MMSDDAQNEEDPSQTDPNQGTEPQVDDSDTQNDGNQTDDNSQDSNDTNGDNTVTGTLTLSHEDVSIAGDESFTLSARSGSGDVTYTSADPSIATVSDAGVVTGVSRGTTEIVVRRGSDSAACIVRVKSDGQGASSGGGTSSGTSATLNREDMTLSAGETFTLRLSGVTTEVTWSTANSNVATVSSSGTVTGVSSGTTRVTASWDGHQATCIVRVR